MSKLIEELSTIPEWNVIGKVMKDEFSEMETDKLDNLDEDEIQHILWKNYQTECNELVAKLVMIKVREEWRQESKDEFDRFVKSVTKDWSEEDKAKYFNQKKGA